MKLLTKRLIASIAVFAATIAAAYVVKAIKADAHRGFTDPQLYPKAFIVSACDHDSNRVFLTDANNNEWVIFGVEDWAEGDIAATIMNDSGTPDSIYDDKIVDIRYSGYIW